MSREANAGQTLAQPAFAVLYFNAALRQGLAEQLSTLVRLTPGSLLELALISDLAVWQSPPQLFNAWPRNPCARDAETLQRFHLREMLN